MGIERVQQQITELRDQMTDSTKKFTNQQLLKQLPTLSAGLTASLTLAEKIPQHLRTGTFLQGQKVPGLRSAVDNIARLQEIAGKHDKDYVFTREEQAKLLHIVEGIGRRIGVNRPAE
jgi:ribulose bisphosphate carboxylase small subunit